MRIRTLALATLGILWLGTPPSRAATTAQEKFEKKVARFALPLAEVDMAKARGLCTCGINGQADPPTGSTGLLAFEVEVAIGFQLVNVTCEVPVLDGLGGTLSYLPCPIWTLLSR